MLETTAARLGDLAIRRWVTNSEKMMDVWLRRRYGRHVVGGSFLTFRSLRTACIIDISTLFNSRHNLVHAQKFSVVFCISVTYTLRSDRTLRPLTHASHPLYLCSTVVFYIG
jgi:hypothetical protein